MTTDSISNSDGYDEPTDSPNRVTTNEARDRLEETLFSALQAGANTLIDAPTSLGKSHKIATTPWLQYPEITGGDLVIHIHQTRDARDQAVEKSRATDGLTLRVLKGREDVCPTAAGDYDDELTAPNGLSPSEWFEHMCDVRKNGFYTAHLKLERHFDRNIPCAEDGPCQSLKQWWQDLRDDDGNPTVDIVHTTANFAHVEGLIEGANLVFDERPEYAVNLGDSGRQQIRDSLANLVYYRSDGQYSISDIVSANLRDDDEMKLKLRSLLDEEISKDWYFRREETHRLAPEIGLAMLNAEEIIEDRWAGEDVDFCGRRMGEYQGINVVMNSKGKIRHVHYSPDLSEARCVIGLDAFPSEYRWGLNTVGDLIRTDVLESTERQVWRREERGLEIVQIGTNTRAYTRRWKGAGKERADGLIQALRQRHGEEFRTGITPGSIEDDIRRFMRDADMEVPPPIDGKPVEPTMHYGEQNSRNDFERESVGLLVGCIDPGDKNILDLLALGRECAWPETTTTEDGEKVRKPDRSYLGEATDTAYDILQSVRGSNIAQGVGRYARSPGSSESSALVSSVFS
ncbi:hypothetical protein [Halobacterium salinarum]|uniref:Uncharacterized protein n=1 Tax=Halobacterium salinarum TaxID=2242 RepID=A0A841HCN6_HALSI|nr:hypothetical protein [Halobacterium salinarum]MBB6090516.1 hypothetical protein [Halobacterium salinarum]UEB92823.1 hypothetical protein LJ422_04000 [Halobacterium salinarum NRC-34001]